MFAEIEHASRRIRILDATAHPTASWVTQTARNLVMNPQDADTLARLLIRDRDRDRDRDRKYPDLFNQVLADAGIEVVPSSVRTPRMNSTMERWIQTCVHELPDRTLIWNQAHLLHVPREFVHFHNDHRPQQGTANTRPLHPPPEPLTNPGQIAHLNVRRRDRLGETLHEHAA